MIKNNFKAVLFGALLVAMILPFSGMPAATAQISEDMIDQSKIKTTNLAPKMLTKEDMNTLAPRYLELEDIRNKILENEELSAPSRQLLADTEAQMTEILERVAEHKEASRIALAMPEIDRLKMELAVQEIIESNIPFTHVGVDPHTKSVIVGVQGESSLQAAETQIRDVISVNVPLNVYEGTPIKTVACTGQQTQCDPIVGGIEIEWGNILCTLSLEVKEGWWSWANVGFLTAGHCFPLGSVGVDQPAGNNDIGDVTNQDYTSGGDCDCEFIDKTTSITSESKVWLSSNTYKSITSKGDASVNDWVLVSWSQTTGTDWDQVWLTEQTVVDDNGKTITGVTFVKNFNPIPGDSGSPIAELFGNQYHGLLSGEGVLNGQQFGAVIPWSNINPSLGVY